MREVYGKHPAGTIIVAQGQFSRFPQFESAMDGLLVPHGTQLFRIQSGCCAYGCNAGVRQRQGEWVWFVDDDQAFQPDILLRLLDHDKDLVAPLVPERVPPFHAILYKQLGLNDEKTKFIARPYTIAELDGQAGLLEVEGLPKSGLLAREVVWRTMPDPWFKIGKLFPDQIDDDRVFMWEARNKHGFKLWADLDLTLPHLNVLQVGVSRKAEMRTLTGSINGYEFPITVPAA